MYRPVAPHMMRLRLATLPLLAVAVSSCTLASPITSSPSTAITQPATATPKEPPTQMPREEVPTIENPLWLPPTPGATFIDMISSTPPLQWCGLRDPKIETMEYLSHAYPAKYACRLLATSPDGTAIALATLERSQDPQYPEAVEVVKRVDLATSTTEIVFRPDKHGVISAIDWAHDQSLLVSDGDAESCREDTLIFPPGALEPSARIFGRLKPESWNVSNTALFTVNYCPFTVPPSQQLYGYDFASRKPFPAIVPFHEETDGFFFIQSPTWSQDGTRLALTLREGNWVGDYERFLLRSSYVVVIEISPSGPRLANVFHDETTDFSFELDPNGDFVILTAPYTTMYDPRAQ